MRKRTKWQWSYMRYMTGIVAAMTPAVLALQACGMQEQVRRSSMTNTMGDEPVSMDLTSVTTTTLAPGSISVKKGAVSNQPLSVLGKLEQTGSADDWNTYLEFTPASTGSAALFTFTVPSTVNLSTLTELSVIANYKGQAKTAQIWSFLMYDNASAKWITIGDNTTAQNWTWTNLQFKQSTASGNPARFINNSRKISLRYQTATAVDASDLDYLVVNLASGSGPSPTATPVPTATPSPTPAPTPGPGTWWKPTPGTSWQIQYSGTIDTSLNVKMYMLDMFMTDPAVIKSLQSRGVKVVCYIDGGSWESYTPDAGNFPASILGKIVDGWPQERFLDIRSKDLLWPIMRARLDLAKQKGCDGIYHDWADSYLMDTGFPLTAQDQLTYNRFWVAEAHARNMSVGLINALLLIKDLANDYDWSINESCAQYNECQYMDPFIAAGKPVFSLNYSGNTATVCSQLNARNFDALFKNVDLGAYRLPCR